MNDRTWRTLAYAVAVLFAIAWTVALGPDLHWDALNYHFYLGFSAVTDRFSQDFFAAGPPSYVNPYAYVPLYLANSAGWSAFTIAIGFAALQSTVLWFVYEIALAGAPDPQPPGAKAFAILAMVLAVVNPIFLQSLGTTFIDLLIGTLVVAGWAALTKALRNGTLAPVLIAGALCGVASALKLSNAIFALAALPALAWFPGTMTNRVKAAVTFALACSAAGFIVALPWAFRLWQEFDNPFFPFLNQWFRSPDFTAEPLRYERYMPTSWIDALLRPLSMLQAKGHVHTEPRAPDLRYLALLMAFLALALAMLRSRHASMSSHRSSLLDPTIEPSSDRVLMGLLTGFAVAWCSWLAISGNSRYFLPMACIAGAVLALVLQRTYARWPDATRVGIALILLIQAVQIALGSDWRREGRTWSGPWLSVQVPARLRAEPFLYLSLGFQSGSALAPYLHPGSGMMNVSGFQVIAPGHPGGDRARRLIDRYGDRVRMLLPLSSRDLDERRAVARVGSLSGIVARFGFRVVPTDCEFIRINGTLRGVIEAPVTDVGPKSERAEIRFLTCPLVAAPEVASIYARNVKEIDSLFDRIEDACPTLFHPRRAATELRGHWVRTYNMGSEVQLWIDGERLKYFKPVPGGDAIDIGSVAEWRTAPQRIDCSRKAAPAFGGVLE